MDIQYLLALQDFRNGINNSLTPFMEFVSAFAVEYLLLIPIFLYWFWNKRKGLYTLTSFFFCMLLNPLMKLTACVYRPWIRDSRILPAGDSIRTATGYSFPSGHTSMAGPLYGGMAVSAWDNKRTRWVSWICVFCILLTGFSRNYLGVHTPQDVFVGICLSVLSLIFTMKLFEYLDKHPEKEVWFLLGGFILCWAGILYITLKPYPMTLDAEGKLLVDPQKMMNDGYGDIGRTMGFMIARFVEKKWIGFKPLKKSWGSAVLCMLGLIPVILLKLWAHPALIGALGPHWGRLTFSVIEVFFYIALFPLILKVVGEKVPSLRADDEVAANGIAGAEATAAAK